jgi:thiol:disulfide interchange protein DsbD
MGLVAAPCIGPVVIGLLVYVAAERDVWKGLALFLAMGFGMGLPYVFLASAAGSLTRLPRAGEWLRWMNRLFGVLLLGMAIYFVSPLLDGLVTRILASLFIAWAGLYLGFLEPSGHRLRAFTFGRRIAGACAIAFAAWVGLSSAQAGAGIRWEPLTVAALDRAIAAKRPAVVEFSAEWCLPCVEMEHTTFTDPTVLEEAKRFSMLQADVTEASPENDRLLEQFAVLGVPTIIFYDASGREVDRAVGFVSAEKFAGTLARIGEGEPAGESPQVAGQPDSGKRVGT